MPNFESLRVSLAAWEDTPLFQGAQPSPDRKPRRQVLEEAFADERSFLHRGRRITFLPVEAPRDYVAGYMGRELHIKGHTKNGATFEPEELDTYDVAFFALHLAGDQQIAMLQFNGNVGSPRPLLESFFHSSEVRSIAKDYVAHVKPLTSEEGYYEAAEEFAGQITKIVFTFIPPNALRAEEKVYAFITEASKEANSESLKHEYDSPSGRLDPTADLLAGSERVAAAGGGETIMKSGRRTIFQLDPS